VNTVDPAAPTVGLTVPAKLGDRLEDVGTPALIVDLDAFERNIDRMRAFCAAHGVRHRAHAKTHKSADIALIQMTRGGACGVCCQKVSEAEALVAGGVRDVLVSNQVIDRAKIDRLAALAGRARVLVCVDDAGNVDDLSAAARRHGSTLECLVEIDVGAGRCGVAAGAPAVALAKRIAASPGLKFSGLQAYHGGAQHLREHAKRRAAIAAATGQVETTLALLKGEGLDCPIVGGAGTGTYPFEGTSGVYNELQAGSYVFMDADYQRDLDEHGHPVTDFENALFIWTQVMSHVRPDRAVCDAGLKVQSVDSGLPVVFGRNDVAYVKATDEHGVIDDPHGVLRLGDKLKLVPGHCDPTCNVHDWYVGVRAGCVEVLWRVTARGMSL